MFIKYSKVQQTYNLKLVECLEPNLKVQVTEKLHGANFSFIVDRVKIKYCSRNQILTAEDNFHNYKELKKYDDMLVALWSDLFDTFGSGIKWSETNDFTIQVYGEYVGPSIQKGADYGHRDFYCFDIRVNGEYISTHLVEELCKIWELNHVPVLSYCILKEALEFSNEFISKLTPDNCKVEDNVCEGIVIKPIESIYVNFSDTSEFGTRVIFKSKNAKWAEKASGKATKIPKKLTEAAKARLDILLQYATENRVRAVVSKEDPVVYGTNFGKLLGAVAVDALEDAKTDYPDEDFTEVTKVFNKELSKVIRPVFLELRNA